MAADYLSTYRQHFFKILTRHSHKLNSAIPRKQQASVCHLSTSNYKSRFQTDS